MTNATSRSLLRPANQKPTICYCKPGECSAPKPEWCIGRRYSDGFREANAEPVAAARDWHSTPAMRARIRELARPDSDDYDKAVIAVLDDFEAALAQSDVGPIKWRPDANMRAELDRSELVARALLKEIMKQIDCIEAEGNIEWHKRIKLNGELYLPDLAVAVLAVLYTVPPRPDASADDAVDQMAMALHDEWYGVGGWSSLTDFERKRWQGMAKVALAAIAQTQSDAELVGLWRYKGEKLWHECNEAEYRILGDNPEDVERRLLYTAPPRPDASAGLIEAAEWHEKEMSRDSYYARRIHEDSAKHFRARAADRSGKP